MFLFLVMIPAVLSAQKKDNGKVYIEHPAILIIKAFTEAFVKGDSSGMADLLADDFKSYNGVSTKAEDKGTNKKDFLNNALRWSRELDYFSVTDFPGAYPDAIEYKKDNDKNVVWVQTWESLKGVHKVTGVKLSSPAHRLYVVTKENKIKTAINYQNDALFVELGNSFSNRTNGTIYNHHPNINTIRKMIYAFENGDVDKSMDYFSRDAKFYHNSDFDHSRNWEEEKAGLKDLLSNFEIKNIEIVGYPDYLEYELRNGRSVMSWWNFYFIRKSDKKEIKLAVHLNDDFDADGKIVAEVAYFDQTLLEK